MSSTKEPGCQLSIDEYSLGDYNSVRICNNAPMWWGYFFAGYRIRFNKFPPVESGKDPRNEGNLTMSSERRSKEGYDGRSFIAS